MDERQSPGIFDPDAQVIDKKGNVGTFKGFEERGNIRYARYAFGENDSSLVPEPLAKQRYKPAGELKDLQEQIKQQKGEEIRLFLEEGHESRLEDFKFEELDKQSESSLRDLLEWAHNSNCLFRTDLRHPNVLFEEGFLPGDIYDSNVTYLSPQLSGALFHPTPEKLPVNWDGTQFIYFVDPTFLMQDPGSVEEVSRDGEIELTVNRVPSSAIKCAVERKVIDQNVVSDLAQSRARFGGIYLNPQYSEKS